MATGGWLCSFCSFFFFHPFFWGLSHPQFGDPRVDRHALYNSSLNETQKEAIEFVMTAKDVSLVHGPPGTGKTTTVAEIVRQAASMGDRVLVCAPSNVAVDNIVEKLSVKSKKFRIVRVGHPARLLPSVLEHSLDAQVERADGAKIVKEIRQDMSKTLQQIRKTRDRGERRSLRGEMRILQKEVKQRELRTIEEVIEHAQIVCTTITGAADRYLRDIKFDLVVIDEAAQALEVACWIPILRGERLILAGDHCQLPPTVLSEAAAKGGMERTLFDRLHEQYGTTVTRMLRIQYRMNSEIMTWSSEEFYGGALEAHESVADHLLCELPGVSETLETSVSSLFIDTAGEGFCDSGNENESKYNEGS